MSTESADTPTDQHRELPIEEVLRRAQPLPAPEELVIDDLTDEGADAFLAAVKQ
jgi:hypothetical protein